MSALDTLKIASPCPMKWNQMAGDDRVRRCASCRLDVYNLSAMTEGEATSLLDCKKGQACVTFLRRTDGTVITGDCRGGFSDHFWEKFPGMERGGLILLFGGLFSALFFAAVVTLFGDNIRVMFGQGTVGALPGDTHVTRRASKPVIASIPEFRSGTDERGVHDTTR